MVCIRLTSLFLGLLFSLAAIGGCTSTSHPGIGKLANTDRAIGSVRKGLRGEARGITAAGSKSLRGRKIGVEDAKVAAMMESKGAMSTVANCGHGGKGELDLECELSGRRSLPSSVEPIGLITFSSDYYAARIHPPKNN